MAASLTGSLMLALLVLPSAHALSEPELEQKKDRRPFTRCSFLHREFNSMNCSDPADGPQTNASCQEQYWRVCKNHCTLTPPTDLECYRASGHFVHNDTCENIDSQIARLTAEREAKACQEHGENMREIRLVGGSGPNEGRVELFENGVWGRMCDNEWDVYDAKVVCRWAGFPSTKPKAWKANAHHFGQGDLDVIVYYLRCNGSEATLKACLSNNYNYKNYPWGATYKAYCGTANRGAGVTCL